MCGLFCQTLMLQLSNRWAPIKKRNCCIFKLRNINHPVKVGFKVPSQPFVVSLVQTRYYLHTYPTVTSLVGQSVFLSFLYEDPNWGQDQGFNPLPFPWSGSRSHPSHSGPSHSGHSKSHQWQYLPPRSNSSHGGQWSISEL